MQNHHYGFGKTVALTPEQAEARVTETLKSKGFGVLTRIDVAATLKQKMGKDIPPYVILGACNPQFAHQALQAEPEIGLLLPCNVVVYQDSNAQVHVSAMDPEPVLNMVGNPRVAPVAAQVKTLLHEALEAV
ncbi:MAG: DUF302 domain-containing protein [Pseudomonadota bacterium]